jgi:hypothetical protein
MTRLAATRALAVIIAASTSVIVGAQGAQPTPSPSINTPSFPVSGLNSPSFPLRGPLGMGPPPPAPFDAGPDTFTRLHPIPPSLGVPFGFGFGYGYPFYGRSHTRESTYEKMYRRYEPGVTTGMLFLDVAPATALVFVDTVYVGSVSDLQARGVTLAAGRHYVDLEAPGYDRKTIEITITAGEPLRYRYEMTSTQRAAAIALPSGPPQTMYAIPGCYGGNRPPVAANLPTGCDVAKVRVIRPQPRAN